MDIRTKKTRRTKKARSNRRIKKLNAPDLSDSIPQPPWAASRVSNQSPLGGLQRYDCVVGIDDRGLVYSVVKFAGAMGGSMATVVLVSLHSRVGICELMP